MIELPATEHWPAKVLAKTFSERQLCEAISYLDLVLTGELIPGPEMYQLGIDVLNHTEEELRAVQNRLALAIQKQSHRFCIRMIGKVAA